MVSEVVYIFVWGHFYVWKDVPYVWLVLVYDKLCCKNESSKAVLTFVYWPLLESIAAIFTFCPWVPIPGRVLKDYQLHSLVIATEIQKFQGVGCYECKSIKLKPIHSEGNIGNIDYRRPILCFTGIIFGGSCMYLSWIPCGRMALCQRSNESMSVSPELSFRIVPPK